MTPSSTVKIWWDVDVEAYRMTTPYSAAFVNALHMLAPRSSTVWEPTSKTWTFTEAYLNVIKDLAEKSFHTTATVITKQQSQNASSSPATRSNPIDKVIVDFFRLLPYEAAQKAYRDAAMRLHPDRNPNATMETMTKLNAAWQRLEKEVFNRG